MDDILMQMSFGNQESGSTKSDVIDNHQIPQIEKHVAPDIKDDLVEKLISVWSRAAHLGLKILQTREVAMKEMENIGRPGGKDSKRLLNSL
eukprot:4742230-Karenia_brevis.AAC.1